MARKFLTPIDLAKNELQNLRLHQVAGDASSPAEGQLWWDSSAHEAKFYDGSAVQVVGTGSGSGNVSKAANAAAAGVVQVSAGADKTISDYAAGAGLLKSSASGVISPAVAGTDYLSPSGDGSALTGLTESQISGLVSDLAAKAPLASPALTGSPTAPTPTTASGIAIKSYVDAAVQGLSTKYSVKALASSNVTLSGTQTIDGVACAAGDRVLLTGQATASQNGIWVVASGSWTRPADFAAGSSQAGAYVFVEGGTAAANSGWVLSGTSAVTVDTTSQTWVQFSGAGEITAGTGLSKSGNTLSIENGGVLAVPHGGTGAASLTGLVKGNGTSAMSAAAAGTDYAAPTAAGLSGLILKGDGAGGFAKAKFTATIGNGSATSIAVTHNLGSQDVIAQVRDASTGAVVDCDITQTDANTTTFGFTAAPASNAYKVVIIG